MLEVRATWESAAGHEASRLARLIRRRRPGALTSSAVRRVAFTVVDPDARVRAIALDPSLRETEADSVDLSQAQPPPSCHRKVGGRWSRCSDWAIPAEALIEPSSASGFAVGSSATAVRPPNSTLPTRAAWPGQHSASR